jgi:hypothetical protein
MTHNYVNIETIGSLSQITRPCPIKYKSMKAQHEQVEVDRSQTLTEFIKEDKINLPSGERNSRRHVMNLLFCFLDDCYLFS